MKQAKKRKKPDDKSVKEVVDEALRAIKRAEKYAKKHPFKLKLDI